MLIDQNYVTSLFLGLKIGYYMAKAILIAKLEQLSNIGASRFIQKLQSGAKECKCLTLGTRQTVCVLQKRLKIARKTYINGRNSITFTHESEK